MANCKKLPSFHESENEYHAKPNSNPIPAIINKYSHSGHFSISNGGLPSVLLSLKEAFQKSISCPETTSSF